jgi:hypothetical protein
MFTFDGNGTVLVAERSGGEFHGVWTQVDAFRYSLSAVRQQGSGWQRIRVVIGHDGSCHKLKGTIKVDTLTCPNGSNATCDPNQKGGSTTVQGTPDGWQLTPGGDNQDGSFDIVAARYQRYPQSFVP